MKLIQRINGVGWMVIAIAFVVGARYLVPAFDDFLGNPGRTEVNVIVILSALILGFWGIESKK